MIAGPGALAVLLSVAPADLRADLGDTARDVGEAAGYGVPAIAAAITTIANGTALAYGGSVSQGWRVAGWVAGGVEVAIGSGLLLWNRDNNLELALGVVPVALGLAALATATFVEPEIRVGVAVRPWWIAGGGGAAVLVPW